MKKILLVEDNRSVAELTQLIFEVEGYCVAYAGNGREALDRLDDVHPDLLLTDNRMPLMDGVHLCREVRERAAYAWMPIVMMSAGVAPAAAAPFLDAFIAKPFEADALLHVVEVTLNSLGCSAHRKDGRLLANAFSPTPFIQDRSTRRQESTSDNA